MPKLTLLLSIVMLLLVTISSATTIKKGWLTLDITTADKQEDYKVEYNALLKEKLELTQLSKINIKAKITFSEDEFVPQFFSFRLRHPQYDNLSDPVLATYDTEHEHFVALVDIGDPKHIRHMSGSYDLQIIISDDRLKSQLRHVFAKCQITFRFSLDQPLPNELAYAVPSIIMTEPPVTRVDPPAMFTGFVVLLLCVLFVIFLAGLSYQKANFNLFPINEVGALLNLFFLVCLLVILYMLAQFWLFWTFLQTVQYFILAVIPLSLAANYAFVYIRKS